MALDLVQHRTEANVWDRVQHVDWDGERWAASFAAGALVLAGMRRRSPFGLLMTVTGGMLAWWAASALDERTGYRQQVRTALPWPRTVPDPVVEASEESFPASDAPSWTPTTGNTSTCGTQK